MSKEKDKNSDTENIEFQLDFSKISKLFKKYSIIFLILIPLFFAFYFRSYTYTLPIMDDYAKSNIYSSIRLNIEDQIEQQYPHLPDVNKNTLIEQQFKETISAGKITSTGPDGTIQTLDIDDLIKQNADAIRSRFQDEYGHTYMVAIDPYHFYRYTRNWIEKGHPYDTIKDGEPWVTHMLAPLGRPYGKTELHVTLQYIMYRVVSFFNRDVKLMHVIFPMAAIFAALCVIPAFFIGKKIAGNLAGFFSAMIVGLHPSFLSRTVAGFVDTDPNTLLFPLITVWCFLESLSTKKIKNKIILNSLGALSIALFAAAWSGWWYIFWFVIVSIIASMIYYLIIHRDELKKEGLKNIFKKEEIKSNLVILSSFVGFSVLFVWLVDGFSVLSQAYTQPIRFLMLHVTDIDLWPNVMRTVAELGRISLPRIIQNLGMVGNGVIYFIIGLFGILLMLTKNKGKFTKKEYIYLGISATWYLLVLTTIMPSNPIIFITLLFIPLVIRIFQILKNKEKGIDFEVAFLIIIWLFAALYASTTGVRFIFFMVPPFAIAFGACIGYIYNKASGSISSIFGLSKKSGSIVLCVIFLLLLIAPFSIAREAGRNYTPSMSDAWDSSLTRIRQESAQDAIITSWWDFGHWFKAIADRPVTFDGATQNRPQAHWVGKTLLTDNEDLAVGYLRMLNCGANTAFELIDEGFNDTPGSVNKINEIVLLNKEEARQTLVQYGHENVDEILKNTHCEPPESYFITSQDMVGKSGVWGHFGGWDFNRAQIFVTVDGMRINQAIDVLVNDFNLDEVTASRYYNEIQARMGTQKFDPFVCGMDANIDRWVSSCPSYLSSSTSSCRPEENGTVLLCQNGVVYNLTNNENYLLTNQGKVPLRKFSHNLGDNFEIIENKESPVNYGASIIYDGFEYRGIIMAPELVGSMFNRLYFYEGFDLNYFNKFSKDNLVTGGNVIVWKVDWDKI